jgi:hypothetical protein
MVLHMQIYKNTVGFLMVWAPHSPQRATTSLAPPQYHTGNKTYRLSSKFRSRSTLAPPEGGVFMGLLLACAPHRSLGATTSLIAPPQCGFDLSMAFCTSHTGNYNTQVICTEVNVELEARRILQNVVSLWDCCWRALHREATRSYNITISTRTWSVRLLLARATHCPCVSRA